MESVVPAHTTASYSFKAVLSSIASPAPLDLVLVYREVNLGGSVHRQICKGPRPPCFHHSLTLNVATMNLGILCEQRQRELKVFREMHMVRDFRLVFCVDVLDCVVESATEVLEYVVKKEKERGGFDYLFFEPLVISERRTPRTRCSDRNAGWSTLSVDASAL